MTEEERKEKMREYRRQWDKENKEKRHQYKLNKAIREIIDDINAGRLVVENGVVLKEVKTEEGTEA